MDIPAILTANYPGSQWALNGDTYAGLDWLDDSPKPTEDELVAAWPQVELDRRWAEVRVERDRMLSASDWTRMDDAPLSDADRESWAVYRQALRDVPQQFGDPDAVVWPVAP